MERRKILIVSRSFYPDNSPRSFRTTELVKEFARQGNKVTLLTPKNDKFHVPFEKKFDVTIKNLGSVRLPEININGSNVLINFLRRAVRRGLLQLFDYPNIELMYRVKKALKVESNYDLLISIAVPHSIHWGVAWAWRTNTPIANTWVADCGDPYMGQTLDSFPKLFYFKYLEKAFCRKADYISVPLEEAKKGYYPEFREKIKVIPQGFKFDEVEIDYSSYTRHSVPTFAYAGGFIPGGRDPRTFLDYLINLEKDFKFILYTKSIDLVEPWVKKSEGRIELRDYIPRSELLEILSKMDFLVNFENDSSLMMPSKLIDYYLTGRPVLNISGELLNREAISQFLAGDYTNKFKYNGMNPYRIENVCCRFLDLCQTNFWSNEGILQ